MKFHAPIEALIPEEDLLFVAADAYRWRAADERSIAAYYTGRYRESFDYCVSLLNGADLPLDQRDRVLSNRDFCLPYLFDDSPSRPTGIIERLTDRFRSPLVDPKVTLTITTCRRLELFEITKAQSGHLTRAANRFVKLASRLMAILFFMAMEYRLKGSRTRAVMVRSD